MTDENAEKTPDQNTSEVEVGDLDYRGRPGLGSYSFGSDHWPGLSKVVEECGELSTVAGKLQSTNGSRDHWDGAGDLVFRLEDELADVLADTQFLIEQNNLDAERIEGRREMKLARFRGWQDSQRKLQEG